MLPTGLPYTSRRLTTKRPKSELKLFQGLIKAIEGFVALATGPNNEPLIFGLVIALFGLLVGHLLVWVQFRGRLKDKDRHIADLVQQRNRFQDVALQAKGLIRKSSSREKE